MALRARSPEMEFRVKVRRVAVSTGSSLDLCTFPSTLGSSVAAAALEQLLVVEQSLQSDYFKCNEEARIFLKDIAVAVKKLEEMRKATIELLEIESMELSRLYFLMGTLPNNINAEMEEFVISARKLNLNEMKGLRLKIVKTNNEIEFLKMRILDLKESNEALGEKQEELAKQHEKFVLSLNHTMEKKASTTIYINEVNVKINLEREETRLKQKYIRDMEEQIDRERAEYLQQKKMLREKINEYENLCEVKKQDAYLKKKELEKLRLKDIDIQEKVTTSTVILSDHHLEIAHLSKEIRHWEQEIATINKVCKSLEEKIHILKKKKNKLEDRSIEKKEILGKIKEVAIKLRKAQINNKDLQEKLYTLTRQFKIVLQEENKVFTRKKKLQDETHKQLAFISEKENFLLQRKIDIKNMEEGLVTLTELYRAIKDVYQKNIKFLNDNLERESQRCIITQWKIACVLKRHARWLLQTNAELQALLDKIKAAEARRDQLLEEANNREKEIKEHLMEIEKVSLEVKQAESDFVIREKKLIHDLSKYELKFVKEMESTKKQEDELVKYLPQLQMVEEEYRKKQKEFQELSSCLREQKQERDLLNDQIFQMKRDFSRYSNNMDKVKQELKQLRDHESDKTRSHFELLKAVENEIYICDLQLQDLLLENERLREYIEYIKSKTEPYTQGEEANMHIYSELSWHLIAHHTQYLDLWAEFQVTIKGFVNHSEYILQDIKNLIDKLSTRDDKIERISIWLQGNLEELRILAAKDSPEKKKQKPIKKARFPLVACAVRNILKTKKN